MAFVVRKSNDLEVGDGLRVGELTDGDSVGVTGTGVFG
jgi:hypothetical protein